MREDCGITSLSNYIYRVDNALGNFWGVKQKCKLLAGSLPLFVLVGRNYIASGTENYEKRKNMQTD